MAPRVKRPVIAPDLPPEPIAEVEPAAVSGADGAQAAEPAERAGRGGGVYEWWWRSGMANALSIAGRDLRASFVSPIGWVITPIIIVVVTFFGFLLPVLVQQTATMDNVFSLIAFLLILPVVPMTTMRLLAEERRQGTLEMLLTSPVRDWELVVGKWLGGLAFLLAMFSFTLVYVAIFLVYLPKVTFRPFGVAVTLGNLDWGLLLAGYLGLFVLAAAFTAIGVLASSLTQNQIVAAFLTFGALIVLYYCGQASQFIGPPYDGFFEYVGGANRYAAFGRGQVQLKDVAYFATVVVGSLFIAARVLESRKWR